MIIRKKFLDKLQSKINKSHKPVELIGKPSSRKTFLIKQILPHFFENGLKLTIIGVSAKKDILPFEIISKYCKKYFTYLPTSLLKAKPQTREENLRISLELISSISNINKKIVLLIIDDFHVLSTEEQENFKLLTHPKNSDTNIKILFIGRPGWESDNSIELKSFNTLEYNEFIFSKMPQNWIDKNDLLLKWIFNTTKGHPYFTELFITKILNSTIVGDYPISIDDIRSLKRSGPHPLDTICQN